MTDEDEDVIFASSSSGLSGRAVYHKLDENGEVYCRAEKTISEGRTAYVHSREYAEEVADRRPCKKCFGIRDADLPDLSAYRAVKNADPDEVFGDD